MADANSAASEPRNPGDSTPTRRAVTPVWRVRTALGPQARRRVRRSTDLVLAPVLGSWNSSSAPASVALTLDDGPDPEVTPAMIDRLAELNVRATFFVLTLRAEQYPGLIADLTTAGHEVALHGLDHRRVSEMSFGQAKNYLSDARRRLENVLGSRVTMYRPPYGSQSVASYAGARRAGLDVVVWNADAADWEDRAGAVVAADADAACVPGGILLLHERLEPDPRHPDPVRGAPATTFDRPQLVADVVGRLRRRDLEPCAVSDLTRTGRLRRTAWIRP